RPVDRPAKFHRQSRRHLRSRHHRLPRPAHRLVRLRLPPRRPHVRSWRGLLVLLSWPPRTSLFPSRKPPCFAQLTAFAGCFSGFSLSRNSLTHLIGHLCHSRFTSARKVGPIPMKSPKKLYLAVASGLLLGATCSASSFSAGPVCPGLECALQPVQTVSSSNLLSSTSSSAASLTSTLSTAANLLSQKTAPLTLPSTTPASSVGANTIVPDFARKTKGASPTAEPSSLLIL